MHLDPLLPPLVAVALVLLLVGLTLRRFQQPYVVAYLVAGVVVGPAGLALVADEVTVTHLGSIGVMLLLFFIGMEISLPELMGNWRVAVLGTLFQIILSIGAMALVGHFLAWEFSRIIFFGFAISISSTAVLFKVLEEWNEIHTGVGQNVIGILLVQDLAVIPMLIVLQWLGGEQVPAAQVVLQAGSGIALIALIAWVLRRDTFHLPFRRWFAADHELQVFASMILCFGFALVTALAGLSSALGAFVAGILVAAAKETEWVCSSLDSFRIVFIALFFVSVGMLIEPSFVLANVKVVALLVGIVLLLNTGINAVILKLLGDTWRESLYAGALLSQIGEFSFVLAAVAFHAGIISDYAYQMTLSIIVLTLVVSPVWILIIRRLTMPPLRHRPRLGYTS